MSQKIVCLGGTGQMVLHYYLQLYLLGLIPHRFDAVVIDTDEIINSIGRVQRLFTDLQYGNAPNQALGIEIPTVETFRITSSRGGGTALQRLTDSNDASVTQSHPVHAFFDKETLAQDLKEGLFARPALSSVVSLQDLSTRALSAPDKATVVVVGSVIGGTGGGLIAPVIDEILWQARKADASLSVRAVLFGKYFTPDQGRIGGDENRFLSNEALVLRSIREALSEEGGIERFFLVRRPEGTDSRKPDQEKKGEHLPWPDPGDPRGERNPFWEGAQALEYLLTDTTTQRFVQFEDREVREFVPPISVNEALQQLKKSVQVAGRFVDKSVAVRMVREPWLTTVWGSALSDLYAHFWGVAARAAGEQERAGRFPSELQGILRTMWEGQKGEPGLRQLFPELPRSHWVRPRAFSKIPWPRSQDAVRNKTLFEGLETTARRAAAALLFWSLREGS
jgi:hypothetical protein